jgi:hypothetical protein
MDTCESGEIEEVDESVYAKVSIDNPNISSRGFKGLGRS